VLQIPFTYKGDKYSFQTVAQVSQSGVNPVTCLSFTPLANCRPMRGWPSSLPIEEAASDYPAS
jgi:hypothetical protein